MEEERMDYSHLNVRELKVVCKFFKIDIPQGTRRPQLEALIYMAQAYSAMAIIDAYNYSLENESQEDISGIVNTLEGS
jgi:hypothetical protein